MDYPEREHFERGRHLYRQRRYALAEQEFLQELAAYPDNGQAHAMLALTFSMRRRNDEALKHSKIALGLDPDNDFVHYAHAIVFFNRQEYGEARKAIDEALRIDPYQAMYFQLLADIYIVEKRWELALTAAEQGLEIDNDDVDCINSRAVALMRLNKIEMAEETIDYALEKEPENALTHTNKGFLHLRKGEREKAFEHYRQALRLNPTSHYAREGVVTALKAKNPIYNVFLSVSFWLSSLDTKIKIILILVVILTPLRKLIVLLLIIFGASNQMFNLMLSLDPMGRLVLTPAQLYSCRTFGIWFLTGVCSLALAVGLHASKDFIGGLIVYFIFGILPMMRAWSVVEEQRKFAFLYSGFVILLGPIIFALTTVHKDAIYWLFSVALFGLIFPFKMEEEFEFR